MCFELMEWNRRGKIREEKGNYARGKKAGKDGIEGRKLGKSRGKQENCSEWKEKGKGRSRGKEERERQRNERERGWEDGGKGKKIGKE